MMLAILLSLTLTLSPPKLGHVYEEIRLGESLTIRAEYLPEGDTVTREGMFLTVEDFVILQTELEFSGTAREGKGGVGRHMRALQNTEVTFEDHLCVLYSPHAHGFQWVGPCRCDVQGNPALIACWEDESWNKQCAEICRASHGFAAYERERSRFSLV